MSEPKYQIVGSDGIIYGPATDEQIRQWLTDGRVKWWTPVLVAGSLTWSTLGQLPEFAPPTSPPPQGSSCPPVPPISSFTSNGRQTHNLATAGLVFGILSWSLCCCCAGFPTNLLGLVFSLVAVIQISEHPERYNGQAQAIVGLVLSALSLLFCLFSMIGHHGRWNNFNYNYGYHFNHF